MTGFPFMKGRCCGYPQGCGLDVEACLYKSHPYKRRHVYGDADARCTATAVRPHPETGEDVLWRCVKMHDATTDFGACEIVPTKRPT